MGIDVKVTGRFDNNSVIVESSAKNENPRRYKVPVNKADEFVTKYKKNEKKVSIISNTVFFTSILGATLLTNKLTKNLKSTALKWTLGFGAALTAAFASIFGCSKYIESKHDKLLKQHNAVEL